MMPSNFSFLSTLSLRRATLRCWQLAARDEYFYPRSPCGERRRRGVSRYLDKLISIHALLAESDARFRWFAADSSYFYPRSPCGERRRVDFFFYVVSLFLSTLSLRRATSGRLLTVYTPYIFLSTLSLRRATAKVHKTVGHFCAYETNFMGIASSC